jgi:hypothetical protein
MTALVRALTSVVLLLAGLGLVGSACVNPDGKDWAEWWREFAEARRQGERLEQAARAVRARWATRGEVAREVIAGRLTLLEAAARFREANEAAGDVLGCYGRWKPYPTGECLCRQVIDRVAMELLEAGVPPEGRVLVRRLESELADHLARYGRVELPGGEARHAHPGHKACAASLGDQEMASWVR